MSVTEIVNFAWVALRGEGPEKPESASKVRQLAGFEVAINVYRSTSSDSAGSDSIRCCGNLHKPRNRPGGASGF